MPVVVPQLGQKCFLSSAFLSSSLRWISFLISAIWSLTFCQVALQRKLPILKLTPSNSSLTVSPVGGTWINDSKVINGVSTSPAQWPFALMRVIAPPTQKMASLLINDISSVPAFFATLRSRGLTVLSACIKSLVGNSSQKSISQHPSFISYSADLMP